MKIWDFAIRQPVAMTMVLVAGVILGLMSYRTIPVELFPNVEFPVIVVSTVYPGASPDEIEGTVTSVMEEEFSSLPGIDEVNSTTFEGLSNIVLVFDLDKQVSVASQEVQDKVNVLKRRLPDDAQDPIVRRFNPSDNPILLFAIADTSGELSPSELRLWVEDNIQLPVQRVDGVASATVNGGDLREIQVNLDLQGMESLRIAPQQVIGAIQSENLNIPGGSVTSEGQNLLVRTPGNFKTPADLEDVIVAQRGSPVYLRDVATVVDGFAERTVLTRLNGQESITLSIRRQSGSNTLAASDGVKAVLEEVQAQNPNIAVSIGGDESIVVRESTNGALSDLLWGALLASLVILVFFRNFRNTFLTIIGLPLIMITTIFFMELFGLTLNNISMLALALVIGLVIDDGIVVRENILRWIERGYTPMQAASKATNEVILPVLATTATILAVFLPVAYASGIIGRFFRSFGLTVSIAIVISTIEALTLAPLLASRYFKANDKIGEGEIDENAAQERAGTGWLDRFYGATVNWSLDHRWLTLLIGVLFVAGSFFGTRYIQTAFIPSIDRGFFDVAMKLPPSTPLEVTEREALKVGAILESHPDVVDVFTSVGTDTEPERASFTVKVRDEAVGREPSKRIIEELRGPLAQVPGISFAIAEGVGGGDQFIQTAKSIIIELTATDAETTYVELGQQADMLMAEIENGVTGLVDLESSFDSGKPEVRIEVDRQRASNAGLSTAQVGSTVRTLINGDVASTFRGEGEEAEILVRLQESDRSRVDEILDINILSATGRSVPLRTVAEQVNASGPTRIQRRDRTPIISLGMNVSGRTVPDATEDVAAFLEQYNNQLPEGIAAKLGGDAEAQAESFANLGAALGLAVVFIYMVLAAQFGSFIQPVLIMLAMPLSIIGALIALIITQRPLDMTAFIGFIMLMGLVTKNSILLVDFANKERAGGASADLAMRRAGPVRLRPILMTALSLILAMIPIVIGFSAGSEFRQSMSIAIMGGMVTSTLLTLYIVPVAYSLVIGLQDRGKEVERYQKVDEQGGLGLVRQTDQNLALVPSGGPAHMELQPDAAQPQPAASEGTGQQPLPPTGSPQPAGD